MGSLLDWSTEQVVAGILTLSALLLAIPVIWTRGVISMFKLLRLLVNLPDMIEDARSKLDYVHDQTRQDNPNGMWLALERINKKLDDHLTDTSAHNTGG